ncbi:MAG: glucose-1-phosphate adenylyltransferase subunit GlgD [Firmicutes bacterium]|nr:glucose-1-phosphate adenylyltransferase subunit GlgD [Bacillota bacterium]
MLQDVCALVYAGEENPNLRDLVMSRSVAALPVGGRYRAIDFLLSNMVNSGIRNVGIITQKNFKSLSDHLGSGKEWDLSRKKDGLFMLPPFDSTSSAHLYRGMCDAIHSKLDYLEKASQSYCLLTGSYTVYSADYELMMKAHLEHNADITMLYSQEPLDFPGQERFKDVRVSTDEEGRVRDLEVDSNNMRSPKLGMDVYLVKKSLLEYLVQNSCARGGYRFVSDVLIPNLRNLRIFAVRHDGYVQRLHSVYAYYKLNMDMLDSKVRKDLFRPGRPVYTKIKDEPPVRYMEGAHINNCILGDGCELYGSAEGSVLFRGVALGRGARAKNSIIGQGTAVGENCELENVITDKYVRIRKGVRLIGTPQFPVIIRKGAVI